MASEQIAVLIPTGPIGSTFDKISAASFRQIQRVLRLLAALLLIFFASSGRDLVAQQTVVGNVNISTIGNITNITSIPKPNSGHDYLSDLDATVNPANGALSVRIEAPRPLKRGLNTPLHAFLYDSSNEYTVWMQQHNTVNYGPEQGCGLDTRFGPGVAVDNVQPPMYLDPVIASGGIGMTGGPNTFGSSIQTFAYESGPRPDEANCVVRDNYVYENVNGVRHPLTIASVQSAQSYGTISSDPLVSCSNSFGITSTPYGGDEQYKTFS